MKKSSIIIAILGLASAIHAQDLKQDDSFIFVAHRGASYLAPENTLASMELAFELGADAAECDVMLTGDDEVILFHDKNTKKLTGFDYDVAQTDWDQLKDLSIRSRETHKEGYEDEKIPLLSEVLNRLPEARLLVIEIKAGPEIIPHLKKQVDLHWKKGDISFIAFNLETILAMKKLYPQVPCYYLSMFGADAKKHIQSAVDGGLDGLDLRFGIINSGLMDLCKASGLDVWCWTVNDPETAQKMKKLGVSAVTTDRPAWLKKKMSKK